MTEPRVSDVPKPISDFIIILATQITKLMWKYDRNFSHNNLVFWELSKWLYRRGLIKLPPEKS